MRFGRRSTKVLVAAMAATLPIALLAYQRIATRIDLDAMPPPGELVQLGARRLHVLCQGAGPPTVVLESSGLGNISNTRRCTATSQP